MLGKKNCRWYASGVTVYLFNIHVPVFIDVQMLHEANDFLYMYMYSHEHFFFLRVFITWIVYNMFFLIQINKCIFYLILNWIKFHLYLVSRKVHNKSHISKFKLIKYIHVHSLHSFLKKNSHLSCFSIWNKCIHVLCLLQPDPAG